MVGFVLDEPCAKTLDECKYKIAFSVIKFLGINCLAPMHDLGGWGIAPSVVLHRHASCLA